MTTAKWLLTLVLLAGLFASGLAYQQVRNSAKFSEIVKNQQEIIGHEKTMLEFFEARVRQSAEQVRVEQHIVALLEDNERAQAKEMAGEETIISALDLHNQLMHQCVDLWEEHTHRALPRR